MISKNMFKHVSNDYWMIGSGTKLLFLWQAPPGAPPGCCCGALSGHWARNVMDTWVWINTYENTIFSGMNIHKSQLFWCELQGYKVLTHCHMWHVVIVMRNLLWRQRKRMKQVPPKSKSNPKGATKVASTNPSNDSNASLFWCFDFLGHVCCQRKGTN